MRNILLTDRIYGFPPVNILFVFLFLYLFTCSQTPDEISGSGTIEIDEIQIAPLVPGRISKLNVDEGDAFKTGDILVNLEGREMEAGVAAMDAGSKQAGSALKNAKKEYERAASLFKAGAISKRELDQAKMGYDVSLSRYRAAAAQLSQVNVRLNETVIRAPMDGVVLLKNFNRGEVVMPGTPILTVANLEHVHLKIYVPENELAKIKIGQSAEIKVDGHDKSIPSKVVQIADRAEFTPKNVQTKDARVRLVYAVKLLANNADRILKPGMPADGVIVTKK